MDGSAPAALATVVPGLRASRGYSPARPARGTPPAFPALRWGPPAAFARRSCAPPSRWRSLNLRLWCLNHPCTREAYDTIKANDHQGGSGVSHPTYTKAQEEKITKRALGRIAEMSIYLAHHSVAPAGAIAAYQFAEVEALRSVIRMSDDVRAVHIMDLEETYPEVPTPVQAAIADFARASMDAMKQHEEEVARFYATGNQDA